MRPKIGNSVARDWSKVWQLRFAKLEQAVQDKAGGLDGGFQWWQTKKMVERNEGRRDGQALQQE